MIIQVYAFTKVDEAVRAVELGVDHIGFIAGTYGRVHGELDFQEAQAIRSAVALRAKAVALTMATEIDEIVQMADTVKPDFVHISTDPMEVDPEAMRALRGRLPKGTQVMKAIPVEGEESLRLAERFASVSDVLLLDTKLEGMPGVGATGATHDWRVSRAIVEQVSPPVILAGGLSPENVAAAIEVVKPWGVDSNTGTNVTGEPVAKDLDRVADFVKASRGAGARDR